MFSRIINVFLSIIMFVASVFGINIIKGDGNNEMISYNYNKTEATVTVKENPSTGYRWEYNIVNNTVAKISGDRYINTAPPDVVGAAGERVLSFVGLKPGTTKIILSYKRSWENEPIRVITLNLTVKADKTLEMLVMSDINDYNL